MAPQVQASRVLQFGAFEVDLRTGTLRKSGARIKLQEQPFQVLTMLLDKPGDMVTREELRQKLWPADTFVDFDHGLNSAVARLREALNDSAEHPRYVETVARRGYRFVAPLEVPGGAGAEEEQAGRPLELSEDLSHLTERRKWGPLLAAIVLLGVLGGAYLLRHAPRSHALN